MSAISFLDPEFTDMAIAALDKCRTRSKFVISHDDRIQSYFSRVVRVSNNKGFSRLRGIAMRLTGTEWLEVKILVGKLVTKKKYKEAYDLLHDLFMNEDSDNLKNQASGMLFILGLLGGQ